MKVNKDIDIRMLKDMLGNMIERCQTSLKPKVELDYNTAIRIYDVLEETQIREERHQTLESACTFMEMEDGTQTNEMELHNKTDENGNILRGAEAYEKISRMVEHLQKEGGIIPECFGTFRYDRNLDKCFKCKCIKECSANDKNESKTKEEREKEAHKEQCFGSHINGNEKCNLCIYERECMNETKEKEKCEALAKHE